MDIKLSQPQITKVVQFGRFLVRPLTSLLKNDSLLFKKKLTPLVKSVPAPVAAAGIHKNNSNLKNDNNNNFN